MGTLIQNGTVVTADRVEKVDVLIEGSTIREVRAQIDPKGHTVVDAAGLFVLPGGIDAHTHMDMPFGGTVSADDFLTGTRAAAIGGTTTIVDFAIQAKGRACGMRSISGGRSRRQGLHRLRAAHDRDRPWIRQRQTGVARYGRHGAGGRRQLQLFMAYPNVLMVDGRHDL